MYPEELRYSKSHEWVRVDGDNATIGITEYAVNELGDIVNVELPRVGEKVRAEDPFGSIDSVKAVSDLTSPVTGEVTEVNTELESTPEVTNAEPYGAGWMIKVKMSDTSELNNLMTSDEYEQFIEPE